MGARFSAPLQSGPGAHQAPLKMSTESYPGVRRTGHGVNHPPSSAEDKERVELYLYPPSVLSWPVLGRNLPGGKSVFVPVYDRTQILLKIFGEAEISKEVER